MKKSELKEKRADELNIELDKLVKEYTDLKFKKITGVLENPLKIRTLRRDISRINTILHMNELNRIKNEIETNGETK